MKFSHLFLAIVLATGLLRAAEPPSIAAKSAILFDANSGKILYKKNPDDRRAVASTQKLLTALIVAEGGNLDEMFTIKSIDTDVEPTVINVRPGQKYSRIQLLTGLLVKSGNDVARALARDHAGSLSAFAAEMNAKMRELGGKDSNFVTPNGLPAKGQYSTARDMARVARAAYRNQTLRGIMKIKYYDFRYTTGKTLTLKNTNRVLRYYSFCNGMKTGYTNAAGHCLISSGSYKGKDVISVMYGASKAHIWEDSRDLLAYGLGIPLSSVENFRVGRTD